MPTKFDYEGFKGELYFLDGDEYKKLCNVTDIQEIQDVQETPDDDLDEALAKDFLIGYSMVADRSIWYSYKGREYLLKTEVWYNGEDFYFKIIGDADNTPKATLVLFKRFPYDLVVFRNTVEAVTNYIVRQHFSTAIMWVDFREEMVLRLGRCAVDPNYCLYFKNGEDIKVKKEEEKKMPAEKYKEACGVFNLKIKSNGKQFYAPVRATRTEDKKVRFTIDTSGILEDYRLSEGIYHLWYSVQGSIIGPGEYHNFCEWLSRESQFKMFYGNADVFCNIMDDLGYHVDKYVRTDSKSIYVDTFKCSCPSYDSTGSTKYFWLPFEVYEKAGNGFIRVYGASDMNIGLRDVALPDTLTALNIELDQKRKPSMERAFKVCLCSINQIELKNARSAFAAHSAMNVLKDLTEEKKPDRVVCDVNVIVRKTGYKTRIPMRLKNCCRIPGRFDFEIEFFTSGIPEDKWDNYYNHKSQILFVTESELIESDSPVHTINRKLEEHSALSILGCSVNGLSNIDTFYKAFKKIGFDLNTRDINSKEKTDMNYMDISEVKMLHKACADKRSQITRFHKLLTLTTNRFGLPGYITIRATCPDCGEYTEILVKDEELARLTPMDLTGKIYMASNGQFVPKNFYEAPIIHHKLVPMPDIDFDSLLRGGFTTRTAVKFSGMNPNFIKEVIFNGPATIVKWQDGEETIVQCRDGEEFDPEKGLAMAISKRFLGNTRDYYITFLKALKKFKKDEKKKAEAKAKKATAQAKKAEKKAEAEAKPKKSAAGKKKTPKKEA